MIDASKEVFFIAIRLYCSLFLLPLINLNKRLQSILVDAPKITQFNRFQLTLSYTIGYGPVFKAEFIRDPLRVVILFVL